MFHDDRTPSFGIYKDTKDAGRWKWKCFTGCGGGDAHGFIAKYFVCSMKDAHRKYEELAR